MKSKSPAIAALENRPASFPGARVQSSDTSALILGGEARYTMHSYLTRVICPMMRRVILLLCALAALVVLSEDSWGQRFSLDDESPDFANFPTGDPLIASDTAISGDGLTTDSAFPGIEHSDYQAPVDSLLEGELVNYESPAHSYDAQMMNYQSRQRRHANSRRWFTTYENVLLQPLQSNTTGVIVETSDGYSHVAFPWELSYSPRVQFGSEAAGKSLGWRIRYWQFRHTESFLANDANGLIPIGTEATVGYLSEDGDITTGLAFIREGGFRSRIRTDVIDWEFQRQLAQPFDFYAGIRYAKVAQGYRAFTDQGDADARSEFRGMGPTVALRFKQMLPYERLSLFADLRGSLLFGKKEFSVIDDVNGLRQSIGEIDLRSYADGANSLATNAELQLGVRYTPLDWLAMSVAFECQHYGNVGGPNPTGVFTGPDSGLAGDGPLDDGLGFAGLTVGADITW